MSTTESLKEVVKRDLSTWLREDPAFRSYVLELTREAYVAREEANDRFDQTLEEMRRERERQEVLWRQNWDELKRLREEQNEKWKEQNRKWDEQNEKWKEQSRRLDEQNEKWKEQNRKWDEQNEKWKEQSRRLDEQNRKWDDQNDKWKEQSRRWDENQSEIKTLHQEIVLLGKRLDRSIGALGARWGLRSEKAFRDALAAILEKSFGVEVINVCEYDDSGEVFGRPEQVELDVIIKNGLLILCELKSSIDKPGMYSFERKARFYERRHERQANRLIVVSPMIDSRAQRVAERLGIETYGEPEEVIDR